jgi:hypothetical protein
MSTPAASTASASSATPAEDDWVPCHTRKWNEEKRTRFAGYKRTAISAGLLPAAGSVQRTQSGAVLAPDLIQDGDFVLIETPQGQSIQQVSVGWLPVAVIPSLSKTHPPRRLQVGPGKKYRMKKQMTDLGGLVGHPYGTSFDRVWPLRLLCSCVL